DTKPRMKGHTNYHEVMMVSRRREEGVNLCSGEKFWENFVFARHNVPHLARVSPAVDMPQETSAPLLDSTIFCAEGKSFDPSLLECVLVEFADVEQSLADGIPGQF